VPDAKFGPGPLVLVTSWFTESSFVHSTVPPFATVTDFGLNEMFFIDTCAVDPPAAGAVDAGAVEAGVVLLLLLPPPPPQAVATSTTAANTGTSNRFTYHSLDQ